MKKERKTLQPWYLCVDWGVAEEGANKAVASSTPSAQISSKQIGSTKGKYVKGLHVV